MNFGHSYGGLKENGPLTHSLNALLPGSGTVWEGIEGMALLEKMCHWFGGGFELSEVHANPTPATCCLWIGM